MMQIVAVGILTMMMIIAGLGGVVDCWMDDVLKILILLFADEVWGDLHVVVVGDVDVVVDQ